MLSLQASALRPLLILHPHLRVLHHTNCWPKYLNQFNEVKWVLQRLAVLEMCILWLKITVGAPTLWRCLWNLSYVLLPSPIITMVNLGVTLLLRRTLTSSPKYCLVFWALEDKSAPNDATLRTHTMDAVQQDTDVWFAGIKAKCGVPVIILLAPHGLDKFNWMYVGQLNLTEWAVNRFKQH